MFNRIKYFVNNSFIMDNIDNLAFILLCFMLSISTFVSSDYIGIFALLFSLCMIFKFIFKNDFKINLLDYEKAIIVFFLIVTVSLFGSTLFKLSLHGYIKTFVYILFYFSISLFFKDNKNKVQPLIMLTVCLMSAESFIAIAQNHAGVLEISGWQDMSNINPEEVISRAYGTLKPYNPNLLAGYLLCGLSSFIFMIFKNLKPSKRRYSLIYLSLFLINLVAIIDTGCRGAYLGFLFFFPILITALIYHINKTLGGISNIKKRYKNIFLSGIVGLILFIYLNPALIKRVQSIFALRADSSISFRFNVYESVWRMFLDNPYLGIGVGNQNFREIYGLYMKTGFDALGSYCVPLEIAVESGIFALIAFLAFLFLFIKHCINIFKNDNCPLDYKILALSFVLMTGAVMGHGLFDTIWFRPQVQILFWTNIAMLKAIKD